MDKQKAHEFIDRYERQMQKLESRFTARQLALFRMLAKDLDVPESDIPMLLIEFSMQRIQDIETLDTLSTLN